MATLYYIQVTSVRHEDNTWTISIFPKRSNFFLIMLTNTLNVLQLKNETWINLPYVPAVRWSCGWWRSGRRSGGWTGRWQLWGGRSPPSRPRLRSYGNGLGSVPLFAGPCAAAPPPIYEPPGSPAPPEEERRYTSVTSNQIEVLKDTKAVSSQWKISNWKKGKRDEGKTRDTEKERGAWKSNKQEWAERKKGGGFLSIDLQSINSTFNCISMVYGRGW